jgi:hypothetical protein
MIDIDYFYYLQVDIHLLVSRRPFQDANHISPPSSIEKPLDRQGN